MTQPNELTITISQLPDNSAFTVGATDRIMCVVQDNQDLQSVLNEVLWAIKHHNTLFERPQIQKLKTPQEPIKIKKFTLHSLTNWIKNEYIKS